MRTMVHATKSLKKYLHLVSHKIDSTIQLIYGSNLEVLLSWTQLARDESIAIKHQQHVT